MVDKIVSSINEWNKKMLTGEQCLPIRYGCSKVTYKIIGSKVLRDEWSTRSEEGWEGQTRAEEGWRADNSGEDGAYSLPFSSLPQGLQKILFGVRAYQRRKFLRIFYCVTIFMVIVIINLLGLFMSVAYKESHDRGEKERKEGGETRVEVQGRRFYSTRQSEFRDHRA